MAVAELDAQLEALKNSKEDIFPLDTPFNPLRPPANLSHQQAKYLQYAYYNTVLDIHTALTNPWSQSALGLVNDLSLGQQVALSSQKVAQTCRNAIVATQDIQIEASTPHPYVDKLILKQIRLLTRNAYRLTFFGPMNAFINLFIHVLKFSHIPKIQSDVALLNVCAGHFARLEFATESQLSSAFATDVAALARKAINSVKINSTAHHARKDLNLGESNVGSPKGEQIEQFEGTGSPMMAGHFSNGYDVSSWSRSTSYCLGNSFPGRTVC
jgi:hypothetical protein